MALKLSMHLLIRGTQAQLCSLGIIHKRFVENQWMAFYVGNRATGQEMVNTIMISYMSPVVNTFTVTRIV